MSDILGVAGVCLTAGDWRSRPRLELRRLVINPVARRLVVHLAVVNRRQLVISLEEVGRVDAGQSSVQVLHQFVVVGADLGAQVVAGVADCHAREA